MSELLNSGRFGILDKDRNSNHYIFSRWNEYGFLEGLDKEVAMKVALSYEITSHFLLMDYKSFDMVHEITGRVIEINEKLDTVIFPIIRRIVSKTPEAADYIPEIINTCKKHYNSPLAKAIYTGEERHMKYLYDVVLPKWSSYHRDREHKDYDDYKRAMYDKYISKNPYITSNRMESYEEFVCMDWEAEFCAAIAEKIETDIKEKLNIKEDETN